MRDGGPHAVAGAGRDPVSPAHSFGHAMLAEWALDPAVTYLNHGTVGAPPRRVLEAQQRIRDQIERQPSRFLLRELTSIVTGAGPHEKPRIRVAADEVAGFLGVRGDDLAFVENATTGVNAVLRSFDLSADDELLLTDATYGGVARAAEHAARVRGAHVRTVELPFPTLDGGAIVDAIARAIGPHTRMLIVDHITSESALILPVREIAARCHERGVAVLVDGAHAPGAIALDISSLGVDWYVGNLHKWAWSPRSSGILWALPGRQAGLHPSVISWGLDLGFSAEFDWLGTRDPSAHLAAPAGIAFMRALGVEAVRAYNHGLAWEAARMLSARWKTRFETPEARIGTMATIPLPERMGSTREQAARLRDALLFEDGIEVQLHASRDRLNVRVSAQIYNDVADYQRLAEAIAKRA